MPPVQWCSGAAKTREEASTGQCGGRDEETQSFFVNNTAGEDETSEGNPLNSIIWKARSGRLAWALVKRPDVKNHHLNSLTKHKQMTTTTS